MLLQHPATGKHNPVPVWWVFNFRAWKWRGFLGFGVFGFFFCYSGEEASWLDLRF